MKSLRSSRIMTAVLAFMILALIALVVDTTVAFFTDARKSENTFTAGNVYIDLSEAAVKSDGAGNLIEDETKERIHGEELTEGGSTVIHNYGFVFPGQNIYKDPTIRNTGKNEAWIAAKVVIEDGMGDIHRLFGYNEISDDIDIERLLTGGLLDEQVHVGDWNGISDVCHNENYAMIQTSDRARGRYEFYFIMLKPFETDDEVMLFDGMFINDLFGNGEMLEFRDLRITVQAYAVQEHGFSDCLSAMKGAFAEDFEGAR